MNAGQTVRFKCLECLVIFDLHLVGMAEEDADGQGVPDCELNGCPFCGSIQLAPAADAPTIVVTQ